MILDEKFWLAVCFFAFVILVFKPAKKAILNIIDNRINKIKEDIAKANSVLTKAEEDLKNYEEQLNNILLKRNEILDVAKADIEALNKDAERELEILLKHKNEDAINRLDQLQKNAVGDLKESFTKAAKELIAEYLKNNEAKLPSDAELASHLLKK